MAKEQEGETASTNIGQSKKQPKSQQQGSASQDSDSQRSDHAAPAQKTSHHPPPANHHLRPKHQKHVVGGGVGRLHARVSSSKALHKHSQKFELPPALPGQQQQQQAEGAVSKRPQIQRRVTAESSRPSRDSSSSANLRRNVSHTHIKRNSKSQVELPRKPAIQPRIKRSDSASKLRSQKTQVHFDLGNDEEEDEEEGEGEWVDASGSASPLLSRRTSVASAVNSDTQPPANTAVAERKLPAAGASSRPTTPASLPSETHAASASSDKETSQHNQYLTSRVLQRTPSRSAVPPQMSSETAEVPLRPLSPDRRISRQSSTLSGTPRTYAVPSSSKEDELSSRFINGSASAANEGSFYAPADGGPREARRNNGSANGPRRPVSVGSLAHTRRADASPEDDERDRDRERARILEGGLSQGPSRRSATAADSSRTQQKLNLMRASSTLEPSPAHGGHLGGHGPLIAGANDPRAGKILERTGMEYLVVRRYQNPVSRSIARLNQLPSTERSKRIPGPPLSRQGTASSRMSGPLGLSQSFRQPADILPSGQSTRPATPARGGAARQNGTTAEASFGSGAQDEELSGASLVENGDDGTTALLRSLWDRRMDFASASQ